MWLWWWAGGPTATYGAGMTTAGNTSKVAARHRVREAQARANAARAQRERANMDDAVTLMVAASKARSVDVWEAERLAAVCEQVRAEANKRRSLHRAEAGAAIAEIQGRGETLTAIAELSDLGIKEIRVLLRYAPNAKTRKPAGGSGALGGGGAEFAAGSPSTVGEPTGAAFTGGVGNGHAAIS